VHYRLAKLEGTPSQNFTMQERLTRLMNSPLGADARERLIPVADDEQHQGCLNYSKHESAAFFADIMHLDGRRTLPRWIHPTEPKPVAEVVPRDIADGEASLGEPLYILVAGNHVAAIERMGFRTTNLTRYLNGLLAKGGEMEGGTSWRLVPKVEITGDAFKRSGVKKVIVKPHAAIGGDAASEAPVDPDRKKARRAASALEDLMVYGQRVFDMLVAAGADETKLEKLKDSMSADLVLKAKLELSVASIRRKTTAEISPDDIQLALAELAEQGSVTIISSDGKSDGKLVQLVHTAEVLEVGGLLDWKRATQALSSAMSAWAAKGAIELAA
jgi:hypothetical protein